MKALLIPSAIAIPKEMQSIGKVPSVLYPINNYPVLDYLLDIYCNVVDNIYIVVNERKEYVYEYIRNHNLNHIKIIDLTKTKDLGYTILQGIEFILDDTKYIKEEIELYINFGDTILKDDITNIKKDSVYYSKTNLEEKWTFFDKNDYGSLTQIIDKQASIQKHDIKNFFVGVFYITNVRLLGTCLKESLDNENDSMDSFFKAIKKYSLSSPFKYIFARHWFDIGHGEQYFDAKIDVRPRTFNQIRIDKERGILTKTSSNKKKLIDEINWYLKLPNNVKYMTPRIYEYSTEITNPFVSMEYYSYHTLHEIYLYGDLKNKQWETIFKRIKLVIDDMSKHTISDEKENIEFSLRDMYLNKTIERLNVLSDNEKFYKFFNKSITLNGKKFPSLNELIERLKEIIEKNLIKNDLKFSVIHGDLCFTNILIDDNFNFLRIIDPRGRFGKYDIYGDSRYEFAKLFHCLEGKYDYIINNLFSINVNETNIEFIIDYNEKSEEIFKCFLKVFKENLYDIEEIRFIESLLFFSMIPLHSESIKQQYAMLATALLLLDKCKLIGVRK